MGLLFNTQETVDMVALVNRHFGAVQRGGAIDVWRGNKNDVSNFATKISKLAADNQLLPQKDLINRTRSRWLKWLDQLGSEPANVTADPAPFNNNATKPAGTLDPAPGTFNTVEKELRRQVFNALNDSNCKEVSFIVIPASAGAMGGHNMSVAPGQTVPLSGNDYIYVVTVSTVKVDDF